MDIKIVPYARMLKQEFPALASNVIDIVDKHDPEKLKIKEVYDLLVAQKSGIDLLNELYGAHPVTKQLTPVRKKCFKYAQEIVNNMNFVVNVSENNLTDDVVNTEAVINIYLHRLVSSKNEKVVLQRLAGFFTLIDKDEALETALTGFGLSEKIDILRSAYSDLSELLMKRKQSKSERSELKTKVIIASIIDSLKNVIKLIEVSKVINKEINYSSLIKELNETIAELRNTVSMRLSHNKKKADALKENESNNESTNPLTEPTRMMTNLNVEPNLDNGFEKGFAEKLDQKKTVASSSKHLQPPIDNEEA